MKTTALASISLATMPAFNSSNISIAKELANKTTGLSYAETMVMITVLVVLIVLILFGNGLVLGIFYQYKPLRTVTNYFIVSLAVADILVAVFCIPIWIAYIHCGLVENKFGAEIYRFWICLDIMSGVSSVMNLTFVSVDRYIYVILPYRYGSLMTSVRSRVIICLIWLFAVGLAMIKVIAFDWARPNYEILIFILGFLLPLMVMGVSYFRIFGVARLQLRMIKNNNIRKREFKAAKTIAVVILAFFICWCPFFVLNLLYGVYPSWKVPGELVTVSKWFHYTNSALNPVIYACFNHEYRSAFRALLARKRLLYGVYYSGNDKKNQLGLKLEITSPMQSIRALLKRGNGERNERNHFKESCL